MMMILCVTFVILALYNFAIQRNLSKSIFAEECTLSRLAITTVINSIVLSGLIFIDSQYHDVIVMAAFLLVSIVMMRYLYKIDMMGSIFTSLSQVLNLYAIRMIVTAMFVRANEISVNDAHVMNDVKGYIAFIAFIAAVPFVMIGGRTISKKILDVIRTDYKNLIFSNTIMLVLFVYISLIDVVYSSDTGNELVELLLLRVGIGVFLTHMLTLSYTYIFAQLKLSAIKCEQLSHIVAVEEQSIRELKETASTDQFTGLKLRSTAEEVVNIYLKQGREFFVLLFDMDGLKKANDLYGHEEGDFYILNVAKTLSVIFDEDTVARVGGDEFLVVSSSGNEYEYIKKSVQCNREITQLKKRYQKPYNTSISYGIVHIGVDKVTNFKEIYHLADQRMYSFKKENKKERRN